MKNQKKISRNFLFVLTFIGTVVAYKATDLLIQQMFANAGGYDYKVHSMYAQQMLNTDIDTIIINLQGLGLNHGISYPVWHLLFLLVEKVQSIRLGIACNISTVSAATTGIFEAIVYLVTVYLLCRYSTWKKALWVMPVISGMLLIMGPLSVPALTDNYYLGQFNPNVWHNPTTIAVKGITLVVFFIYVEIIEENNRSKKQELLLYFMATVLLFASAFFKPSFYQMFVPALFVYCVIELIVTKGKYLKREIGIGFTVLPVTILAVAQMMTSFGGEGDGIGIQFMYVWHCFARHPFGSLLISIPFPLLVYIGQWKNIWKEKKMTLAVLAFLSAVGQFAVLYTKNTPLSGDFIWGAYLAVGILNLVAVLALCKNVKEKNKITIYHILCIAVFLLQVYYGMRYIMAIYLTSDYLHIY